MAYTPPADEQDPWYDEMIETLDYLRTTAEGAATTAGAAAVKGNNLSDLTDALTARNNLGLGTAATANTGDFDAAGAAAAAQAASQPVDSDLTAIAALTTTAYGRAVLALANQAALMALLSASTTTASGIVELATSAETTTGTDTVRATTPAGVKAVSDLLQPLDTDLTAIAGLVSAADRLPYFTGSGTASLATFTAAGRAIVDDADAAAQRTTLALGNVDNTSDATKNSATSTLTNKRVTPRVDSTAATATYTFNWDNFDAAKITAQNAALNVANPTGTPTAMQRFVLRVKDNGTARAITYGTQFRAIGVTLPTTTVLSKTVYLGCIWNSEDTKVDVLAVGQEA